MEVKNRMVVSAMGVNLAEPGVFVGNASFPFTNARLRVVWD